MSLTWAEPKDPDEVLDYAIDWLGTTASPGPLLRDTDTISTSIWIVPSGITKNSDTSTTTSATIWLSGGTAGNSYVFTNRITTAGGRTHDQSVKLKVKEK